MGRQKSVQPGTRPVKAAAHCGTGLALTSVVLSGTAMLFYAVQVAENNFSQRVLMLYFTENTKFWRMRLFPFFFLMALANPVFAQIAFQSGPFSQALAKAKDESKLVFLQVASPSCRECNAVADKGLSDKELSQLINQTFVAIHLSKDHRDRWWIESTYNLPDGFGVLFIDGNGTLIHRYAGSTTQPQQYKEQIDLALYRAGESLKVSELEKEYRNGNKAPGFLEQLLLKKKALNLSTTELLNEYVSLLPADSLSSVYTLQFIASLAPVYGSSAYTALRKDAALFNRAWYALPSGRRAAINSAIIHNSLNKAILEKNEGYAFQVAAFAQSTYTSRSIASIKAYGAQMLQFYERTNDTAKYLTVAARHYDLVARSANLDSIKKQDSLLQRQALNTARKDTMKTANGYRITAKVQYNPLAQRHVWELKEAAWNVCKRTNSPELLAKATAWIEQALSLMETHEALDVYARLLYKRGQNEKAVVTEKKALEMKRKAGYTVTDYEATLAQMQGGLALTD